MRTFSENLKILALLIMVRTVGRLIVYQLSNKYNVEMPRLKTYQLGKGLYGKHIKGEIRVDVANCGSWEEVEKTIYHEFRHEWQHKYYENTVAFFAAHPDYGKFGEFYRNSLIELDARRFENTFGKLDGISIIEAIAPGKLEELDDAGVLSARLREIASHVHYA